MNGGDELKMKGQMGSKWRVQIGSLKIGINGHKIGFSKSKNSFIFYLYYFYIWYIKYKIKILLKKFILYIYIYI